jgi:hypothetical protein
MSFLTLEVEIDHGRIVAVELGRLPQKGKGLLIVLEPAQDIPPPKPGTVEFANDASRASEPAQRSAQPRLTPLQALEALQKHLKLDEKQAVEWMATVRGARR